MSNFTDTNICWMCQSSWVSSILLSAERGSHVEFRRHYSLLSMSVESNFIDTTVYWTCQSNGVSLTLLSAECVSHIEIHWHYYRLNVSGKSSFTDTTVCWMCRSCRDSLTLLSAEGVSHCQWTIKAVNSAYIGIYTKYGVTSNLNIMYFIPRPLWWNLCHLNPIIV
jgi:hypothetical protein